MKLKQIGHTINVQAKHLSSIMILPSAVDNVDKDRL